MQGNRFWKVLKIVLFIAVAVFVFSFIVMHLWNWLMPAIFGLHKITYWQGLGLLVLAKILFGGFRGGYGGRRHWRQHLEERWANMSPEEREKFRAGMRGRHGCGFGRREESVSDSSQS
jgi:hypothetical protein